MRHSKAEGSEARSGGLRRAENARASRWPRRCRGEAGEGEDRRNVEVRHRGAPSGTSHPRRQKEITKYVLGVLDRVCAGIRLNSLRFFNEVHRCSRFSLHLRLILPATHSHL